MSPPKRPNCNWNLVSLQHETEEYYEKNQRKRKIQKIIPYAAGGDLGLGEEGRHRKAADLVQRGSAGRKPGAGSSYESGGKAGIF